MPVSSSTSRTAACSAVSPSSRWPFGRDQSRRPRRSSLPMRAALVPVASTTRPPAEVSSTVRIRRREPRRRRSPDRRDGVDTIAIVRRPGGDGDLSAVCRRGVARVVPPCPAGVPSPARRRGTVTCRARSRPGPRHVHRRRSHGGGRDAALLARRRRPRRAVRGGRTPALPRGRQRAGCAAGTAVPGPRLHHRRAARADPGAGVRVGGGRVGHRHRLRHRGRRPARRDLRDHHLPGRRLRRREPQPRRRVRRLRRGRPRPPRLHGQRHGAVAARPHLRRPVRRARRPGPRRPRHPDRPGDVVRRRPAAAAARGPLRLPARVRGRAAGARGDGGDGAPARTDHRGAGAGGALEAAARRAPPARDRAHGRHRARRRRAARGAGDAPGDRRARPAQGRLRALADGDGAGHRPREPDGGARTSSCASPRCCTTSGSRRRARSSRGRG